MRHPLEQSMVSMWTVMEPYKILMISAVGPGLERGKVREGRMGR